MSFVRWSSDDYKSDVYAYEHCDGFFTVHVASMKRVGTIEPAPSYRTIKSDPNWMEKYSAHMKSVEAAELVPIGLVHDGETFDFDTLEGLRDMLIELKTAGYHVPDWTIENINEELPGGAEE